MDSTIIAEVTGTDNHITPFDLKGTMSTQVTSENIKQGEKDQTTSISYLGSDSAFLVLAPVLSSSYPTSPSTTNESSSTSTSTFSSTFSSTSSTTPSTTSAVISDLSSQVVDITTVTDIDVNLKKNRRSSSVSSSASGQKRYLKLGPVHWGGDGAPDFVEVDE